MQKFINLHSGSRVKLLTLAAAAKQPSILPSPEREKMRDQYLSLSDFTWWDVSAELLQVEAASSVEDGIYIYVSASTLYD